MNQLERKNKKKNFIWNAIGLSFNAFNSFFFLVIIKLVNGLDTAGIFTYAFALCCFFFVISIYYNRTFQVSDIKNKFSFNEYFSCRILTSVVSLIAIVIFAFANQFEFYKISVIVILMLFRILEAISECFFGAIQKHGELYKTGISYAIKAIGGIMAFLVVDILTHDLILSIIALIAINLAVLVFYDLRNFRKITTQKIHFDFHNIKKILKICFPIFLFTALAIYLSNCQKYILTYFTSNDLQSIFGILIMPATMLSLVGSYLINPFINHLTLLFHRKKYDHFMSSVLKILGGLTVCGFIVIIVCWFIGIPVLNFIYQMNLDEYQLGLILVMIASLFYSITMLISSFLTILKENKWQSLLYIIASVVATGTSIWLIPLYGVYGAIISFLVAGIILTALYFYLLYHRIHNLKRQELNHVH